MYIAVQFVAKKHITVAVSVATSIAHTALRRWAVRKVKKKSEAQIFLEQVEMLDALIECKLIERIQWHELALNITANMSGEVVQSSGSQSKMADAVNKCIDMEGEIAAAVDKLIAKKREATQTIEKVDNATWYKILHERYIQHIELQDIADNFGRSYDWVKSTHGRAIQCVQRIRNRQGM